MRKFSELLIKECRLLVESTDGGYRLQANGIVAVLLVGLLAYLVIE